MQLGLVSTEKLPRGTLLSFGRASDHIEGGDRLPDVKSTLVQKRPRIPNWPINAKATKASKRGEHSTSALYRTSGFSAILTTVTAISSHSTKVDPPVCLTRKP